MGEEVDNTHMDVTHDHDSKHPEGARPGYLDNDETPAKPRRFSHGCEWWHHWSVF